MLLHVAVTHCHPEEAFRRAGGQRLFCKSSRAGRKKTGEEWERQGVGAVPEKRPAVRAAEYVHKEFQVSVIVRASVIKGVHGFFVVNRIDWASTYRFFTFFESNNVESSA